MKRQTLVVLCAALFFCAKAQTTDWLTGGNIGQDPDFDFLGNQDPVPMNMRTDDIRRFRLNYDETYTIGSFGSQVKDGCLLLSPDVDQFYTNGAPGPYSLLHLASEDDNAQEVSYRDWMRIGITLTGNADHSYYGQKAGDLDYTDVVLHWSDNPAKTLKDRMRFLFTSEYDSGEPTGAYSREGLEAMRLYPVSSDEVYVGIGDFYEAHYVNAGITEPEERLDVVNGRVRVRDLPTAPGEMGTIEKYVVVDDDGVLGWRQNCEWTMSNTSPNHVYTAVGSASANCPDGVEEVGIGTSALGYGNKLTVLENTPHGGGSNTGINSLSYIPSGTTNTGLTCVGVRAEGAGAGSRNVGLNAYGTTSTGTTSTESIAVHATANPEGNTTSNYAVKFNAVVSGSLTVNSNRGFFGSVSNHNNTAVNKGGEVDVAGNGTGASNTGFESYVSSTGNNTTNMGVRSVVYSTGTGTTNYGVYANTNSSGSSSCTNYAVYATVPDTATYTWAGYFNGKVQVQGNMWHGTTFIFSDSELKTNVEDITAESATDLLGQLSARTYHYNAGQYPHMNLPTNTQFGFLAQEVEEVLPQLVGTTVVPEVRDSTGNVLAEEMEVKGINYVGLIPLLVAGFQAQSERADALEEQLTEQTNRLDALEQALSNCCSNMGGGEQRAAGAGGNMDVVSGNARALTIQPNPFSEQTTLYYTLEHSGLMQLMANSADGKQLRVLSEAALEAGQYQHEWHTSDLSPGVYYVTLLLDGEAIVKKAVKVQR